MGLMYDGGMKRKHITIDPQLGKEIEQQWARRMTVSGRIGFGKFCDEIIRTGLKAIVTAEGAGVQVSFTKEEVENG